MPDPERWRRARRFFRADVEAEVDDELSFHLDELVRDLVAQGLPPEAARAEALRRFGKVDAIRAASRRIEHRRERRRRWVEALDDWGTDLRFALRLLRRGPGFTTLAIVCLGLGIGVTGAITSAAHAILVRPLPYRDADRLVAVYSRLEDRDVRGANISYPDYEAWRDRNRTFSDLGMWTWWTLAFSDGQGDAERVEAAAITGNLFPLLGVSPTLGRTFAAEEGKRGGPKVILLGHAFWTRRYAADSGIVGRSVTVDGQPATVIGVMPPAFAFPEQAQAWIPFVPEANENHGNRGYAGALGRLRPGITFDAAAEDLERVSVALEREFPDENLDWRADPVPLRDDLVGNLRGPLRLFLAAAGAVLLIVCANVASLLLVRGATRRRELAVRSAIGAGRGRLVRQLVVESLTVAVLGGLAGLGVASLGVRLFGLAFPAGVPFYIHLGLDRTSIAMTAGITLLTGFVVGLLPALRATDLDLARTFREGGDGAPRGRRSGRLRSGLVVAELAVSVLLLITAGLLLRSYRAYTATPLGFDQRNILSARITLPPRYATPDARREFFETLLTRLDGVGGVEVAGSARGTPMSGWNVQAEMSIEGYPPRPTRDPLVALYQYVTPDYFRAIGVPLLRGRGLLSSDRDSTRRVALINELFARTEFPNQDPIGRRIRWGDERSTAPWITIVGVVGTFRHFRLPQPMMPAVYLPYLAEPEPTQTIVLRSEGADPAALVPTLRALVRDLDPDVPIYRVETLDEAISRSLWRQRLQGQVVTLFAALALVLAAVGIYGVISYGVTQRARELGVRAAIGASSRQLVGLVVQQGLVLGGIGIGLGLAGALLVTRSLRSLLYDVGPADPLTFLIVSAGLWLVALAASWIPARRAARADPLVAMRSE